MITVATISPLTEPTTRRVWSVSQARDYSCPRRWSYRNGPHRIRFRDTVTPRANLLGSVLHRAIGAAFAAAEREAHDSPGTYPLMGRMTRYEDAAKAALSAAWSDNGMPRDGELAHDALGLLSDLLANQMLPPPGAIVEVEQRHTLVTDTGLPFVIVPDLVLNTTRGLLLRDWKLGDVSQRDPGTDYQLNLYVAGLAALYPDTVAMSMELYSIRRRAGVQATANPDNAARALAWLEKVAATAEADKEPEPRPGVHCSACPFRTMCPGPAQL